MYRWSGVVLAVFVIFQCAYGEETEYHVFSDTQGRSFEGTIMRYDQKRKVVTIKPKDRTQKTVSTAIFSEADQKYIEEWGKSSTIMDDRKLRIDFSRMKKQDAEEGSESGSMSTKAYDHFFKIEFDNKSDVDIKDLTLEYAVFYVQEKWIDDRKDAKEHEGVQYTEMKISIPARKTKEIETEHLSLTTYRESGFDAASTWVDLDSEVVGILLKVSVKTSSGETISRIERYPKKLDKPWTTETKDVQGS